MSISWTPSKRKLRELIAWEKNPRQIKAAEARRLRQSFDEFGQVQTLAISPDGEIYDGHQRKAVLELSEKYGADYEVDVRISSRSLTEDERKKLVILLHKGTVGEWDFDILANSFDVDNLLEWGFDEKELDLSLWGMPEMADAEPQFDRAEELREIWGVQLGDLWQLGEHRLACGDCTDAAVVAKVMGGERAGIVFIDPPYMTFGSSTGKLEANDFNMLAPFWEKIITITQKNLSDGRPAFICCDWRSYPTLFNAAFTRMVVKNLIVWDMGGALKMGTGNFRPSYELLIYAVNTKFGRNWQTKQKNTWIIQDRSERDLWTIPQAEAAPGKDREHASQKPTKLISRALINGSNAGDILFDFFSGSGTTIIACENLKRKCRAIEISPQYVSVAIQRFADAFPSIEIKKISP